MGSLADISERAGVSIATASRVLNGSKHPVSAAMRERVLNAAAELGYAPSFAARALVTGRTPIVGVIVGDIVDPYFAHIARGVEHVAGRLGYLTMLSSAHRSTEAEIRHLRALRATQARGVIFASSGYTDDPHRQELQQAVDEARESGARVLTLAHRELDCPSVTFDSRAAAYDITDYVVSLGHRRIAFVDGPKGLFTSLERCAGYEAAMAAAGLDPLRFEGGFEYEAGYDAAQHIAAAGPLPDAIIGVNDDVAIGIVMGLRSAGIEVPERVSVAGINDTRPAAYTGLTTVSAPLYELGLTAARIVLAEKGADEPSDKVLPHQLVPRSTTRRAN
ncbi:LacI family transcriptional regulator [Actinomadura spongiicola]|uniref:LacI family transcriptional regulator n=1 Tax=Actinomadura spongiicola TaxID=2303421 RepID=A0A372GPR4_9ACTN|nr:LacI family DNA-binding transcriptional regulator [Actinomadura spongiicola]RFS87364.1 LacI family transcriptional regulator [Actinomadura spongiicola]